MRQFGANTAGGFVDLHAREFLIRNVARTTRLEDLADLVIAYRNGQPIVSEAGGRRGVRAAHQARRRRLPRQAGGHPGHAEAARRRHDRPHPRDRARAARAAEEHARRACRSRTCSSARPTFIERSIANVQRVLLEALAVVAVVLFLFLLNWQTTFISITAIPVSIAVTLIVFQLLGLVDQHHDAGRPGHRHRRAGRRCAWSTSRTSCAGCATTALQRIRGLLLEVVIAATSGGALRHPLRHRHHRPRVPAAVRAFRHRGPPVRAARHRLHRLDPGEPRDGDHGDAGAVPIGCCRACAGWPTPRARSCACLKRSQERGLRWCFARPAFTIGLPAVAVLWAGFGGLAVCRAPSCRPSTRARRWSTWCCSRASACKESNRVGPACRTPDHGGARGRIPSAAAPAGPSSTSMPKACTSANSTST